MDLCALNALPYTCHRITGQAFRFHKRRTCRVFSTAAASPELCSKSQKMPHVLTVAGSDSGGGAGIQADIKACGALGVYCSTVITAVTSQNTVGVQAVHIIPRDAVASQLESVLSDMDVDVVKTGMLPSTSTIEVLCEKLKSHEHSGLIVDPVMVATSGDRLASDDVLEVLCRELLPLADIVTPNLTEAADLVGGETLHNLSDMYKAAKVIKQFGPRYVLIKGGHFNDFDDVVDLLYDGETYYEFRGSWINTSNTHGTGCTLASSIAAAMAKGMQIPEAVKAAKQYIQEALQESQYLSIGKGPNRPLYHLFKLTKAGIQRPQKNFKANDLLLYAVTDSSMNRQWRRSISEAVEAAIEGGATMIQVREKELELGAFLKEALACVKIARKKGVPIVINDRLDIAMACDADGVHIGQSDLPAGSARAIMGPHKVIGVSCKTIDEVQRAFINGADYVGSGGIFPTTTKKGNTTIGLDGLFKVCAGSPLPVVAIGGINVLNVEDVLHVRPPNLHGVAVVSALFDQADVLKETRELYRIVSSIMQA